MFRFPYTNLHELNLDWILSKVKEFAKLIPSMETAQADVDEAIAKAEEAKEAAEQASDTLATLAPDIQTAIDDSATALTTAEEAKEIAEQAAGGATPSNTPPLMDGTASAGSALPYSRGDHVHPTDTTRASQADLTALQTTVSAIDLKADTAIDTAEEAKEIAEQAAGGAVPSDTAPNMDGTASAGSSLLYSRGDHVHPSDTSRVAKTGDVMTGILTVKSNSMTGAAGVSGNGVRFRDANDTNITEIYPTMDTLSRLFAMLSVYRSVNSQNIYHRFAIGIDAQGNKIVDLDRTAWKKALNFLADVITIQLPVANWATQSAGVFTQTISISDITANTKIDLQYSPTVLAQMISDGTTTMFVENNNGTLTVYAFGLAPTVNLTVQATMYETV